MKKVIGILGGMGPKATSDAFEKLISKTPAKNDQEHIPVVIVSLPEIPDRTRSIIHQGPSPLKSMVNSLNILEKSGVNCIIMPCNTAHYWYGELKNHTKAHFISIVESACEKVKSSERQTVAILATSGTIKANLYQKQLANHGIKYVIPDEVNQQKVMDSIMAYKSGDVVKSSNLLLPVIDSLEDKGVDSFILACTEIPLILKPSKGVADDKFIDATDELIKEAVKWYFSGSERRASIRDA